MVGAEFVKRDEREKWVLWGTCTNLKPPPTAKPTANANATSFYSFLANLRMNKSKRRNLTLFLLCFIILSHQILCIVCETEQYNEEKPSFFHTISSTLSLLKKSHKSYWEKIRTIIHDFQLQFTPPNLDFRSTGTAKASLEEKMKEAVKKSFGTSKLTVEETAKSAAEAAGEAIHKTSKKIKGSVSDKEESHDEL
ncbi:hypothetical protein REPUB_Repub10bG0092600 [Reevesia pubescens]